VGGRVWGWQWCVGGVWVGGVGGVGVWAVVGVEVPGSSASAASE